MGERETYAQAMREGHVHAWAGRWSEAGAAYRRALEALPGDLTARSSLAGVLARSGLPREALTLFEEVAEEHPDDSAIALRVAELRQRVGRMDDADDAYLRVARLYSGTGQIDKARAVWQRLTELSGHRASTMRALAAEARASGVDDLAAEAEARAVAAETTLVDAPAAGVDEQPRTDGHGLADLAATLRSRHLVTPVFAPCPWPEQIDAGPASTDVALERLARNAADLGAVRVVALALEWEGRRGRARTLLESALDVAELNGELGAALRLVEDLLPLDADPVPLRHRQIQLALLAEQTELAARAHLALARHFAEQTEMERAVGECRRACSMAPLSASIYAAAADQLASLGANREAAEAWRRAFQLAPRDLTFVLAYAASAAREGAVDEVCLALEALDDGLADRDSPEPTDAVRAVISERLRGDTPLIRWCRGRLLARLGDPTAGRDLAAAASAAPPVGPLAAVDFAEQTLAEDPSAALDVLKRWFVGTPPDSDEIATRLVGLGLSAADRIGDSETAIAALQLLQRLRPSDATVGAELAERLAAVGRPADAAEQLRLLAAQARQADDLEAAFGLYAAASELSQSDVDAAWKVAEIAAERGDRDEARRRYETVARLFPDRAAAALLAAAELGPPMTRTELLRRAKNAAPADPEPRRRLIAALVAVGQASLAAAEAAELAEHLHAAGDRAGALAAVEQARRLDPWNAGLATLHAALTATESGR